MERQAQPGWKVRQNRARCRRLDQGAGIDDTPGSEGRELLLSPANDLDAGAVEQQLGGRVGPYDAVDDVIGPVSLVRDAVSVQVERGIVAPVISPPLE